MYEERRTITASRWRLHTEGKDFFNEPGAIRTAPNRELLFADEMKPPYKEMQIEKYI
ncbi:Uncharacterised protein [uncultured archaeon]|nr:Uncharacterised protein [uncultured archaeon]